MTRSLVRLTRVGVLVGGLAAVFALTASHAQADGPGGHGGGHGYGYGSGAPAPPGYAAPQRPAGTGEQGGGGTGGFAPGNGSGPTVKKKPNLQ